jgi:arginine deiminase
VHRPGAELKRGVPRTGRQLPFAGLPWAARAQQEQDIFTQALRDHGVQVLYLTELLHDVLEYKLARQQAIGAALGSAMLGDELAGQARRHLEGLDPEALTELLITGLTAGEFRSAAACRRLPAELTGIVFAHHPLFAGTKSLYRPGPEPL